MLQYIINETVMKKIYALALGLLLAGVPPDQFNTVL